MFTGSQAKLLHQLAPSYQKAVQQNCVEDFFQQAYRVWFGYFPEPHLDDADAYEWRCKLARRYVNYSYH
jgi:hypothetical protein